MFHGRDRCNEEGDKDSRKQKKEAYPGKVKDAPEDRL
jgi:hypothetical protein